MMKGEIDLHIHSNKSSDGDFSPFHIIQLAKKKKLRAVSISDHDTVEAYPKALEFGKEAGVEVIPSIELTTIFDSREFHLLLPFVNWGKKIVFEVINRIRNKKVEEAKDRVQKLRELGFDISWKEVVNKTKSSPPLGVVIAQILLEKSEKKKNPVLEKYYHTQNRIFAPYHFYRDYFMEGKPASVPRRNENILDILKLTPETEGIPVLAHPGAYFQRVTKNDLILLKEKGLEGLEVYTSYHSPEQTEFYKEISEELHLVATAGSDFHGSIKPHIPFGSINSGDYSIVEALRKRRK
ncbi:MAG: PHP domain-containing protein [Candidatus Aminicenantaceae bacterium]